MLVTIMAFLVVLGVIIFVHELGHFLAAKAVGIAVPRFSIGFGSATPLRFTWRGTEYVIAWFPLGGYVKMASKEEQEAMAALEGGATEEEYPPDQLFENKPLSARILVISAGVLMNLLFAWLAYAGLAATLGRAEATTTTIAVDSTRLPPGAEGLAGVPEGAKVLRVNGDTAYSWSVLADAIVDPTTEQLTFEFDGDPSPIVVAVPGTSSEGRSALFDAIRPAYPPVVGAMSPGMPAAESGLESGDSILAINEQPVRFFGDLTDAVEASVGDTVRLTVARGDSVLTFGVVPVEVMVQDVLSGETMPRGRIGMDPRVEYLRTDYGPIAALGEGATLVWRDVRTIAFTLKGIVTGQVSRRDLGGPLYIGQVAGRVARVGIAQLIAFTALISVNLAIFNLLPIPVLDGGHLVFLLAEGIRGRPLPLQWRLRLTQAGLAVILLLMVYVFRNDILRIFGG